MFKIYCGFRYFFMRGKVLTNKFGILLRTPANAYVNYLKIVVYIFAQNVWKILDKMLCTL